MGLHEIKIFCITKGMVIRFKKQTSEWEKFCQLCIRQEINNQNIWGAQKTSSPKVNDPMKKWVN
jgi:hypothetical protein